jgi:flagellar hook-length control protein FliK
LVSVSTEALSNLAFHGAAQRHALSIQHPVNDLFDTLVGSNTASDAAPPSQPFPSPRRPDETPPPSDASAAKGASNPPPDNDPTKAANAGSPSNANSDDSGPTGGDATQPSSATQPASAKKPPPKSADEDVSGDSSAADPTALSQGTSTSTATTGIPVAIAIPPSTTPINVPTATAATGTTTPPLAIAAAAIAASSQAVSAAGATPAHGNGDSDKGPPITPPADAKALSAPGIKIAASEASNAASASPVIAQARQISTAATDAVALTGAVAATVPVTPKTIPGNAAASSPASDEEAISDQSASNATTVAQNGLLQQAVSPSKTEAANAAAAVTTDASASSTPAILTHEHPGTENAARVLTDSSNPGAQTVAALQPQPGSTTLISAPGGALSVTPATNGPVPLSGVALEIAASVKSGKSRFEIRLDPPELGRIDVRIDIDRNGQVTSHLTVEKAETLSILRQDAPQLQRALDDAGLKTASGGLQFSLRDQSSSGQNNGSNTPPNAQRLIITEEDPVSAAVAGRTYGRPLAGSGGVDIRV